MLTPKVSVIIPTRNRKHLVEKAVESVLAQSYQDFELIVVDDGSRDGSGRVLKGYEGRLTYIYEENRSRSATRNLGVKKARGKYVAFLDSDDVWMPTKLERQIHLLESDPTIALVHCLTSVINEKGAPCEELIEFHRVHEQRSMKVGFDYATLALECNIFTSCVVLRREVFLELGGFDEGFDYLEDWDFYLRLAFKYKISVIASPLTLYRYHLEQSHKQALTNGRIQVCQKHMNFLESPETKGRFRLARRNLAIHMGESYFMLSDYAKVRKWLGYAFRLDPSLAVRPVAGFLWLMPHLVGAFFPRIIISRLRQSRQLFKKNHMGLNHE